MIQAVFTKVGDRYSAFRISGHAGYAEAGEDIVCAAVSSAVQLTCNGVTEILSVPAKVAVEENSISLLLTGELPKEASDFIAALRLHLALVAEDHPDHLNVTVR